MYVTRYLYHRVSRKILHNASLQHLTRTRVKASEQAKVSMRLLSRTKSKALSGSDKSLSAARLEKWQYRFLAACKAGPAFKKISILSVSDSGDVYMSTQAISQKNSGQSLKATSRLELVVRPCSQVSRASICSQSIRGLSQNMLACFKHNLAPTNHGLFIFRAIICDMTTSELSTLMMF